MSAGVSTAVSTDALDALIARMERLPGIIEKYAEMVMQEAKRFVPVDTGALRASITTHLETMAAEITAGEGLTYAAAVEYGTARSAAQPFIRPAMERYADAFLAEVAAVFGG